MEESCMENVNFIAGVNEIKSNQIKLSQIKSNQIESKHIKLLAFRNQNLKGVLLFLNCLSCYLKL